MTAARRADLEIASEGWRSKAAWSGKAHYVLADGTTACATTIGPHGLTMGELLTCGWRELDPHDHLCKRCQKIHPRPCTCGTCSIKPATSARPSKENAQ